MAYQSDNVFAKILRKEIPAEVVFESDEILAFRDINPQAPTHVLIIPKKPLSDIAGASKEDRALIGEMLLTAADIARAEGIEEDGYRLVMNSGSFMEVPHMHLHLLGGKSGSAQMV